MLLVKTYVGDYVNAKKIERLYLTPQHDGADKYDIYLVHSGNAEYMGFEDTLTAGRATLENLAVSIAKGKNDVIEL